MRLAKNPQPGNRKILSPEEKVRLAILGNRLNVTAEEADRLLNDIHTEVARILDLPEPVVHIDTEFFGRDLDLTFTINKQNTPKRVK